MTYSPLKAYRLARLTTQAELAMATGIPEHTITKIETGRREATLEEKLRLAVALGCQVHEVFPE